MCRLSGASVCIARPRSQSFSAFEIRQSHQWWEYFMILHVDGMKHQWHGHINLTSQKLAKTPLRWALSLHCSLCTHGTRIEVEGKICSFWDQPLSWRSSAEVFLRYHVYENGKIPKLKHASSSGCFRCRGMEIHKLCIWLLIIPVLPSEIPLDKVELSACPRVGLWISITLSSNRWREPALGNVALLNSAVFILWMKLDTQNRAGTEGGREVCQCVDAGCRNCGRYNHCRLSQN